MPVTEQTTEATLFDKLGGADAVASLVDRFYERVLKDPELEPYFRNVSTEKLRTMQREFFSAALGGPVEYAGRPILHAHHDLRITLALFQRFVRHMFDTLAEFNLSEPDVYDIISRLNMYTNDVVSAGLGLVG